MTKAKKESVLSRWSRRKQASQNSANNVVDEAFIEQQLDSESILHEDIEPAEKTDINCLTDEDMPDIESLNEDSDYAGFLSENVSDGLRKLALQKLFHCKSYNICDGLDDYDGNYTVFEKLDASIITADMKHRLEMEAQQHLEQLAEEDSDPQPDFEQEATEIHAEELVEDDADDTPVDSTIKAHDDHKVLSNEETV